MNKNIWGKNVIISVIILFIMASITLPVGSNEEENEFSFIANNVDESTVEISINIPSFELGETNIGGVLFATLDLVDAGVTTNQGQAKLPVIRRMIEIPYGAEPEIIITSSSWESTSLNELVLPRMIIPVQPSIVKYESRTKERELVIDDEYYSTNMFMPAEAIKIIETGTFPSLFTHKSLKKGIPTDIIFLLISCKNAVLRVTSFNIDFVLLSLNPV